MKTILTILIFSIFGIFNAQQKLNFSRASYDQDKVEYFGAVKDGKANGYGEATIYKDGKLKSIYKGNWTNNDFNGKGTITWTESGDSYDGDWVYGARTGNGKYIWKSSGTIYNGQWANSYQHGKGTTTWTKGDQHFGDYKNGKFEGKGTYYYSVGDVYVGEWTNGERTGYGKYTFKSGKIDDGYFEKGVFKGNQNMATNSNLNSTTKTFANNNSDALTAYNKGLEYRRNAQDDLALEEFNKALIQNPKMKEAYYERAITYWYIADEADYIFNTVGFEENIRKGIADLNKAIELDPNYVAAYYDRGNFYFDLFDNEKALADYAKVIQLAKDMRPYSLVYYNRSLIYSGKGDKVNADKEMQKYYELLGQNSQVKKNISASYEHAKQGDADFKNKNYAAAVSSYTKAIEIDPKYQLAIHQRGICYFLLGGNENFQKAVADATKVIQLDPKFMQAYFVRGAAYNSLKNFEKAIPDLNKVIEINPVDDNAYHYRSLVHIGLGNKDAAISDNNKAIELKPDNVVYKSTRNLINITNWN